MLCLRLVFSSVVYADPAARPDPNTFSKLELWHSDVTYEKQPPGVTSLKIYAAPEVGGDTIWSSGYVDVFPAMIHARSSSQFDPPAWPLSSYALYSSLSPGMQKYLEGLSALHSGVAQAVGTRAAGKHVRRTEIESIHPVVRVHPATGWKSVFVNSGELSLWSLRATTGTDRECRILNV